MSSLNTRGKHLSILVALVTIVATGPGATLALAAGPPPAAHAAARAGGTISHVQAGSSAVHGVSLRPTAPSDAPGAALLYREGAYLWTRHGAGRESRPAADLAAQHRVQHPAQPRAQRYHGGAVVLRAVAMAAPVRLTATLVRAPIAASTSGLASRRHLWMLGRRGPDVTCPKNGTWVGLPYLNRFYDGTSTGGVCNYYVAPNSFSTLTITKSASMEDNVTILAHGTLNVNGGVTVLASKGVLLIQGTTTMSGTAKNPVTLTSSAPVPTPGNWDGIDFAPGSSGTLTYVHISYAGAPYTPSAGGGTFQGALLVEAQTGQVQPVLSYDNFTFNSGWAVYYTNLPKTFGQDTNLVANHNGTNENAVGFAGGIITGHWSTVNLGIPLVLNGTVTVPVGLFLSIAAGSSISVNNNYGLVIDGVLNMVGTSTQPIVLTTPGLPPVSGSWNGIDFAPGSRGTLTYVRIAYAGAGYTSAGGAGFQGAVLVETQPAQPQPVLTNVTFANNLGWALYYTIPPKTFGQDTHLSASGTGVNAVGFAGGTLTTGPVSWSTVNLGIPLQMDGDITVGTKIGLTLAAGSALTFGGGHGLYVNGSVTMSGTATSPITLTSAGSTPAPGNWNGLDFKPAGSGTLSHVLLSYAGGGPCCSAAPALLVEAAAGQPQPLLTNDTFSNNAGWAVYYTNFPYTFGQDKNLSAAGNGVNSVGFANSTATSGSFSWSTVNLGIPLIMDSNITVGAGSTLSVASGSTLTFDGGHRIYVDGTLDVTGTATAPITLTSSSSTPASGDWGGIDFTAGSKGALSHVNISYTGAGPCCSPQPAVLVEDGSGQPMVSNVSFSNNSGWAVYYNVLPSSFGQDSNLSAIANGTNAVGFSNGTATSGSLNWSTVNLGIPLIMDNNVTVGAGSTLSVASGSTITFDSGHRLYVDGTLVMAGTSSKQITLTSSNAKPAPSDWGGIDFTAGSKGLLSYVNISYSGAGPCCSPQPAVLVEDGTGQQVLHNVNFADNAGWAVYYDTLPNHFGQDTNLSATGNGVNNVGFASTIATTGNLDWSTVNLGIPLTMDSDVVVGTGITLTVAAGSTLTFDGRHRLIVDGTAIMSGTATSPISLTSSSGSPSPGDWAGVDFTAGSTGTLNYVDIAYSGAGPCCSAAPAVLIEDPTGQQVLSNDTFTNNGGWAVYYDVLPNSFGQDSNLSATGNGVNAVGFSGGLATSGNLSWSTVNLGIPLIMDNDVTIATGITLSVAPGSQIEMGNGHHLYVDGTLNMIGTAASPITITSSSGTPAPNNWGGIDFRLGSVGTLSYVSVLFAGAGPCCSAAPAVLIEDPTGQQVLSNDTFTNNGGWAVYYDVLPNSFGQDSNLTAGANGVNAVGFAAGLASTGDLSWSTVNLGIPLIMDNDLTVGSGITLSLAAGSQIELNRGHHIYVNGTLNMIGNAAGPITVTSANAIPAPGDWGNINFSTSGAGTLSYVHISYAGSGPCCSAAPAVFVQGVNPTISHSTFDNEAGGDVEINQGGLPLLNYDSFSTGSPAYYGVANDNWTSGNPLVDATNSWWGDASGPSGAGSGSGVAVGAGVNFTPWLTSPVGAGS